MRESTHSKSRLVGSKLAIDTAKGTHLFPFCNQIGIGVLFLDAIVVQLCSKPTPARCELCTAGWRDCQREIRKKKGGEERKRKEGVAEERKRKEGWQQQAKRVLWESARKQACNQPPAPPLLMALRLKYRSKMYLDFWWWILFGSKRNTRVRASVC